MIMAFRATYWNIWIPETCLSTTSPRGAPFCHGMCSAPYSLIPSNDCQPHVKLLQISLTLMFKWLARWCGPTLEHLYFSLIIKRYRLQERCSEGKISRTVVESKTDLLWPGRSSLMLDLYGLLEKFRRPLSLGFSLPLNSLIHDMHIIMTKILNVPMSPSLIHEMRWAGTKEN